MGDRIMDVVIRRIEAELDAHQHARDEVKHSSAASQKWADRQAYMIGLLSRCRMNDPTLSTRDVEDFYHD